jgi:hypothetical protein
VLRVREADFQAPGGYKNPGASPCTPAGVMPYMTIRMRGYKWREKGETFPGRATKSGRSRNRIKLSALVVEKRL